MSDHPLRTTSTRRTTPPARLAGFTLVEVLLSGVLGALLLTSLAYATFTFTYSLVHLEAKAGISETEEAVLRRMTRDVREAWWAEVTGGNKTVNLADPQGNVSTYWFEDGALRYARPNGDEGIVYDDVQDVVFEAVTVPRKREGPEVSQDGVFYVHAAPSAPALPLELEAGSHLSLAFVPPVLTGDLPGGTGDEQIESVHLGAASLPLAWVPGTAPTQLHVELYETRAPGSARPFGPPLGALAVDDVALPLATDDGAGNWQVPAADLSLSLSSLAAELQPGVGYALVLSAGGDAGFVVAAHPALPGPDDDDVAIQDALAGSQYVKQPLAVPFALSGPWTETSTITEDVVTTVNVTVWPSNRPSQTRSATLLSQSLSDDPWFGVVPGQAAP